MAFDVSAFKTTGPLADLTIRLMNEKTDFIMSEILTPHYVPKSDFKWYQYDKSNLRRVKTKSSSKAEANKVDFNAFTTTGKAILHKLAGEVDPMDERDADEPVSDIQQTTLDQITEHLLMDYEQEGLDLITDSTKYPSGLTTSLTTGTNTFLDAASDPFNICKDARAAVRQNCGKEPQAIAMSWEVMEALRIHPALIDRIKFTGVELPIETVVKLLGFRECYIGRALKNTAAEGQTDALSTMWGDNVVVYYRNPAKGRKVMTYGRTFICEDFYTYQYEDQKRGAKKRIQVVETGWEYDLRGVATQSSTDSDFAAGYLIQNAI